MLVKVYALLPPSGTTAAHDAAAQAKTDGGVADTPQGREFLQGNYSLSGALARGA